MTKPLDWAYSKKVSLNLGAVFSAFVTIEDMLSGFCGRSRYVADDDDVHR
jgi:hypothetical protein